MKALFLEMRERARECRDYQVCSIFIGGGTPSILPGSEIEELLKLVRACYSMTDDVEITIEVNPGTVDRDKLLAYRRAGVNRLSIGLQSANDWELQALGRIHSWSEFLDTFTWARQAGFDNVNVDLMSALPGQTLSSYRETLEQVLALRPEHISAYSLIIEEGTPFHTAYEQGQLELPDEDMEREMYRETRRCLVEKGYERYEISNYALPGKECRHNVGYWTRREYLGLGLGAASLMDNVRFHNGQDRTAYVSAPLAQREEEQRLSRQEQMEEALYLGLRMVKGVSLKDFRQQFGIPMEEIYGEVIQKNIRDGLLLYRQEPAGSIAMDGTGRGESYLVLTDRGLDLSNYVMAQFLLD